MINKNDQKSEKVEAAIMTIKEPLKQIEQIKLSAKEMLSDRKLADHVYSHRGSKGSNEHTFEAYDEAIKAGSHNIEQDVVVSRDGTLYVSHDDVISFEYIGEQ